MSWRYYNHTPDIPEPEPEPDFWGYETVIIDSLLYRVWVEVYDDHMQIKVTSLKYTCWEFGDIPF